MAPTESPGPSGELAAGHILALLQQVAARRQAGEQLSDEAVCAAHPELMPELGEHLRYLGMAGRAHGASAAGRADRPEQQPGLPADSVPGYTILREVHRGGQGVVYQALQKTTKRSVAIKIMREGPFASRQDKARFEREVQVLAALKHPNIVAIHESGTAAGSFYYVMDYVSGQPLDAYTAADRRSVRETLALFQKICAAVNAAHLRGVIHRDLKPGNIRIDPAGEPQILDFGLAKVAPGDIGQETAPMTVTGQFVGSLPWASPEQAEGDPSKIDIRTDVYSLGVILYQMLTGRFPYDVVGSMRDVLDRIMTAPPARPSTLAAPARGGRIDDEVETIVLKCLAKERERRYQSAGELARDIGHYLAGEPLEAKRDSSWYVLRKNLWRYRAPAAVAAGFVLLLAGGLVASLSLWQRSVRQRDEAEAQRLLAQHRLFDGLLEAGDSRVKSKQYAEARQAYAEAWQLARQIGRPDLEPRLGWLNSYMASPPPLAVFSLADKGQPRPARSVLLAMGRDGPLVLVQRENVVHLFDPLSGKQVAMLAGHTGLVRGFAVSADGKWYCTGGEDRTVILWDAGRQKERLRVDTDDRIITCAFSPDGRTGFWAQDDGKVVRWELATGEKLWVVDTQIPEPHLYVSPDERWLPVGGPGSALIDTHTAKVVRSLNTYGALASSSDGARVCGVSVDTTLRLCALESGRQIHGFLTRGSMAVSLALSADEQMALVAADDSTLALWNLATGEELASWSGHSAPADNVAFLRDGQTLLSCSARECLLWRIPEKGGARAVCGPHAAKSVAISPDGRTALSGEADGAIRHWDIASAMELQVLRGHTNPVRGVAFLPDGMRAVSSGPNEPVRLWDLTTGTQIATLDQLSGIAMPAVSSDGRRVLSALNDGRFSLWDVQTMGRREFGDAAAGPLYVLSVCFSPDGQTALIGHRGGGISLWNLESETVIRRLTGHRDSVNGVAFLPEAGTALSVSSENKLVVWKAATGEKLRTLEGPQVSWISAMAVAPDGQTIYCASFDGAVRLWNMQTSRQIRALFRHSVRLNSLALSSDGRMLLAASDDGTVSIWDFDLPQKYKELESRAVAARDRLITQPEDAQALLTLGEWFAFREADQLAADYLERGRKAGAAVSPLLLGRCYWRLGRLDEAQQEFRRALHADEAPAEYLQQCLRALSGPPFPSGAPDSRQISMPGR